MTTAIGTGGDDQAHAVTIDSSGRIVVAGFSENSYYYLFAVARYNTNGVLDSSFGSDGSVITIVGNGGNDGINAIALDSSGRIVVAGFSENSYYYLFAVARYNTNGVLDSSFGSDGSVITIVGNGGNDGINAIALDSSGRIVVAGFSENASGYTLFAVARYLP